MPPVMFSLPFVALALIPVTVRGQQNPPDPARFAATFAGGGSVTWSEFHTELARRHRGKPLGKEALEHLVEKRIVFLESSKRKLDVAAADIDGQIARLRPALRARNVSLEEHLAGRGLTMAEFRDYIRLSLLYDRLARADLGLAPGETLPPDRRKLWLREKRRVHGTVTDVGALPPNAAAIVGGKEIGLAELGATMARNLVADERRSLLRQMVAYRILQREASRREIEVGEADYDAALERKRTEFTEDPEYRELDITLEKMLAAQGRSIADLRNGEVFRAAVLIEALGRELFSEDSLRKEYDDDVLTWQSRIGTSRETWRLLVQGPPRRSLDEAKELCAKVHTQVRQAADFAPAARKWSEDTQSKRRGGNLGFLHRREPGVDERLLDAVFRLRPNEISQPVQEKDGWSLLLVTKIKPGPSGKARLAAMRQWKVAEWLRRKLEKAGVRYGR